MLSRDILFFMRKYLKVKKLVDKHSKLVYTVNCLEVLIK